MEFYISKTGVKDSCAWIAPNGTFYPCIYGRHNFLARSICKYILNLDKKGTQELEDRQWIRVNNRCAVVYHLKNKPTQKQIDTLGDLLLITKTETLKRHIKRIIKNG